MSLRILFDIGYLLVARYQVIIIREFLPVNAFAKLDWQRVHLLLVGLCLLSFIPVPCHRVVVIVH